MGQIPRCTESISTLCLRKKVPTFKLSETFSNLNQFSKCLHCWKAYEICYKTHMSLLTTPFLQILCRYERKCKQIAFWVHRSFCRLWGEATKNIFSSIKKTKSVADYRNFWSRSLARFVRAAQFASVSSCARRLLKHFRCKSLQIIRDTDDRWLLVCGDISRTVLWVCGLSCWLRTKSLTVSTFSYEWAQIDGKSK